MAYVMLFRNQVQGESKVYKVCERGPHHQGAEGGNDDSRWNLLFVTIPDGMILNLVRMAEPTYGGTALIQITLQLGAAVLNRGLPAIEYTISILNVPKVLLEYRIGGHHVHPCLSALARQSKAYPRPTFWALTNINLGHLGISFITALTLH